MKVVQLTTGNIFLCFVWGGGWGEGHWDGHQHLALLGRRSFMKFPGLITCPKMSQDVAGALHILPSWGIDMNKWISTTRPTCFLCPNQRPFFSLNFSVNMSSAAMNSTQETAKTFVIQVFSGQQSALFWSMSHFGAQGILFSLRPSTMKPCTVSLRCSERRVHSSTL